MTPPFWPWGGGRRKRNGQADVSGTGSPPEASGSASPAEGDSVPVSSTGGSAPVLVPDGPGAGMSSSVRVEVSGEGAVGAGRDITRSAIGAGSRVEHTEVDNRIDNSTVNGDVVQVGRDLTINNTHHHPAPAPAPGPVWRPVRVGTVPPLASALQPREVLRQEIDRARERSATVVLTQVLSGGGGVGKSQLAAVCAHRAHADGVDVLVWVDATETSQIISTYARAAAQAGVSGADGQDAERDAAAFLDWLAVTDRSWLVVLDDLTDLEAAGPWWPRSPAGSNGRALVTTRRRDALVTGNGRTRIDIGTYTPTEAAAYLTERLTEVGAGHLLDDRASDLAEVLGGLPLALSHAAAYMINEDADCTTYLHLFTDRATRLTTLLPPGADTDGYGRRVTTSLLLALDAVERREPVGLAVPAIRLAALLDPAGHPEQLWTTDAVTRYLATNRTSLSTGAPRRRRSWRLRRSAPVTADQARAVLRLLHHYALITHHTHDTNRAVRLHALTSRAVRETTSPSQLPATVHAAADALLETWPESEHTARELTTVLRTNTDTLATHAGDLFWNPNGHPVLFTAGHSLNSTGLIHIAVTYWQSLAADAERLLGDDHLDTLISRANLALSIQRAGRTGEAIDLLEWVLADRERLLGDDHPDTLTARGNLASFYGQAGRVGEAIDLQERVLVGAERLLGDDHPDTLISRANLALSYWRAGRAGEAIDLLEWVLADRERLLGDDHPDTLTARANLASFYGQAGRTGEAIVLEEQVLADRERLLDSDHLDTLTARANLALSYWRAGHTVEAIGLGEWVLADRERLLGDDHPGTLIVRGNLASFYAQAGRTGEAIVLEERVLVDAERLLGENHLDTLTARANLASSYWRAGRTGEAIVLGERVLVDAERLLGEDHPGTLIVRGNLASFHWRAGRTVEAIDLLEWVLADRERLLGNDHPDTRATADLLRNWRSS
ncbi:tetratricopeptide repeat protein [Kitasatospora sp. NPDC094019]|uniref:tetratricopeptide repeat protein n=1 Tax=Kitasatospora sp. NPDC094019 TaxID=3364091 RepID=UPI00382023DE